VNAPVGLAVDPTGNLYIADTGNHRVRRVEVATGTIRTVAGTGEAGHSGDFGPAAAARLNRPRDLAFDRSGNLYIADEGNHRVRRVDARTGVITTVAGSGTAGFSGDGAAATAAALSGPSSLIVEGNTLYIADGANGRVRAVSLDLTRPEVTFERTTGPGGRPAVRVNAADPQPSTRILRVMATGSNMVVNGESLPFEFAAPLGGLPAFGFLAEKSDPAAPAAMAVTAVDGAGNAARPVWLSLGADGSQAARISLPPILNRDLTLTLNNEGLQEIRVEIAGRPLLLRADSARIGFDGDTAYVRPQGVSVINIRRFVGDGGPVTVTATGGANATGVLEIHP
jgi:hypothetical protein